MVYIAVIVRVQYGDWAEHVYSLTGLLCNKSSSVVRGSGWGEVVDGWVGGGYVYVHESTCTHIKTHSVINNA